MLKARPCRGVSLVELTIVLAVLGILMTFAVPAYQLTMANLRIRSATESLRTGLQLARSEALKRGTGVFFDMTGLDSAWIIGCEVPNFNDSDGDGQPDCPAQIRSTERVVSTGTAGITITPTPNSVRVTFSSIGLVRAANLDGTAPFTQVDVTDPSGLSGLVPLRILMPSGGLSRICDPSVTTAGDTRKC